MTSTPLSSILVLTFQDLYLFEEVLPLMNDAKPGATGVLSNQRRPSLFVIAAFARRSKPRQFGR